MGWDEWERLKAGAAGRQSAGTRLDGTSGGEGPGASDGLRTSKAAWAKAGEGLASLRKSIARGRRRLEDGQQGLGKDAECETTAAQREVHTSWKEYAEKVQKRCADLGELLEQSGHELSKPDTAVAADLEKVRTRYTDTPPVGGGG
ncbi:hypothetical protein [Streptomyces sp. NPDC050560]|uniref:hypothetical protein n=1 Tax=Streptomyces sp. NPDC050560 TaxID=3365630 RepID=UPI0037B33058